MRRFGEYLRSRRVENGLTLKEVAEALSVGISYLSDIERGRRKPFAPRDRKRYLKLAKVLDVDAEEFRQLSKLERTAEAMQLEPEDDKQRELIATLFRKDHSEEALTKAIEAALDVLQEDEE